MDAAMERILGETIRVDGRKRMTGRGWETFVRLAFVT